MADHIDNTPFWTKKVLTLDEVIEYTGFSRSTLLKMTHKSIIPHSKPTGRNLFFDREKLEQWLLRNPVKTVEEIDRKAASIVIKDPIIRKKRTST